MALPNDRLKKMRRLGTIQLFLRTRDNPGANGGVHGEAWTPLFRKATA
jgi:hypothetical protein